MSERICPQCKGIINTETQTHYKKNVGQRRTRYCVSCLKHKKKIQVTESVQKEYRKSGIRGGSDYKPSEKMIDELIAIQFDLVGEKEGKE